MNPRPDPVTFLPMTAELRGRIESTVEQLLALLDAIDGDPDLEDGDDAEPEPLEPYLAGAASDLEHDECDYL